MSPPPVASSALATKTMPTTPQPQSPSPAAGRLSRAALQHINSLEERFDDIRPAVRRIGSGAFGDLSAAAVAAAAAAATAAAAAKAGSGAGWATLACRCRGTGVTLRVSMRAKSCTKFADFRREYAHSRFLSAHPCVVDTFEMALETPDAYALVQELPPAGDLASALAASGSGGVRLSPKQQPFALPPPLLDEDACKRIAEQLLSALEFMHAEGLVHRDVRPEHVLVFDQSFRRVKLAGFASASRRGAVVRRGAEPTAYAAPELCERLRNEGYEAAPPADVWAAGIVIVQMLGGGGGNGSGGAATSATVAAATGSRPPMPTSPPWDLASVAQDRRYAAYSLWQRHEALAAPSPRWRQFTPKLLKMLRQMLEPNEARRCSAADAAKYCRSSHWLLKRPSLRRRAMGATKQRGKAAATAGDDEDGSGSDERDGKAALRVLLAGEGVPSTVTKKGRLAMIKQWLSASDSLRSTAPPPPPPSSAPPSPSLPSPSSSSSLSSQAMDAGPGASTGEAASDGGERRARCHRRLRVCRDGGGGDAASYSGVSSSGRGSSIAGVA